VTPSSFGLTRDPCFREHAPNGYHPERPERLEAIEGALAALEGAWEDCTPQPATDEEILTVHGPDYLRALCALEGEYAQLDPDTYSAPRSLEIARLSAGSAVELARRIARGQLRRGFALVRPPGHHAERERAMGFCLFNNVAVAAAVVRSTERVERIAIVDWDVHHGNGTQHVFESDRDVLYASLHQFPFYPGTGSLREQGVDSGTGTTVNLPMRNGCGDAEYGAAFDEVLIPVLDEFRPELILVSAGFDAHARDPLAGMQVSTHGFARMAARIREVADSLCDGRLLLVLEGGYDLEALSESVAAVVQVLAASEAPEPESPPDTPPAQALAAGLREAHSTYWRSLR
jgi:acetoin utilization deacetylase AcuC-like enzyme